MSLERTREKLDRLRSLSPKLRPFVGAIEYYLEAQGLTDADIESMERQWARERIAAIEDEPEEELPGWKIAWNNLQRKYRVTELIE